ncbi:hypothetical protein [Kineococcus rubinsiae]|nr:hypothetical protein [Kineococcus rubinsiae]
MTLARLTPEDLLDAARLEVHDLPGEAGLYAIYVLRTPDEDPS